MTALLPPAVSPATPTRRTSVPDWPAEAPGLDPTGRTFLLVQIGSAAEPVVGSWLAEVLRHGRPVQVWAPPSVADADAEDEIRRRLGMLHVGARLMVAGAEVDVLAVVVLARRIGLVDEEITAFAVARDRIAVFCAHCEMTTRVPAAPGTELTCPGCRLRLEVHEHVSRHSGSYLASAVDGQGAA